MKKYLIFSAIIIKGISSVIAQTLLLRELLIVFNGNELTFSIILSIWLISAAAGSGPAANLFKKSLEPFCVFQILFSLSLPLSLFIIRFSRYIVGLQFAQTFGLTHAVIITLCGVTLPAFLDGAMFNFGFRLINETRNENNSPLAKTYFLESLGIVIGGLVFTFVLLFIFNSIQIALAISSLNLLISGAILKKEKKSRIKYLPWILFGVFAITLHFSSELERYSLKKEWQKNNLIAYKNSPYGNIAVSEEKEQFTIYYDGLPALALPYSDTYFNEDFIHLSMLTKPAAKDILFIGHAVGGPLSEILKYPVDNVEYIEIDPLFINIIHSLKEPACEKDLSDPRVKVKFKDACSYLSNTDKKFDVIFINAGLPTSLAINRFYTKEFFEDAESALKKDGMLVTKTWGTLSYMNNELRRMNSLLLKTLFSAFKYCKVIPGDGFNIFIASNSHLPIETRAMLDNLARLNLKTGLMSQGYLKLRLDKQYSDWFLLQIKKDLDETRINQIMKPTGLYDGLSLYYSQFSKNIPAFFNGIKTVKPKPVLLTLFLLFIISILFLKNGLLCKERAVGLTVFSTGFFAMSMQITILLMFQSIFGYLFQWLALLTACFMTGAATGAVFCEKSKTQIKLKQLAVIEITLPGINLILAGLIIFMSHNHSGINQIAATPLLFLSSFLAGLLTGLQIPMAHKLLQDTKDKNVSFMSSKTAGILYSLDLTGACLGALTAALIIIPSFGIAYTIALLFLIKLLNGCNLFFLKSKLK